jgi:hypothetical protein
MIFADPCLDAHPDLIRTRAAAGSRSRRRCTGSLRPAGMTCVPIVCFQRGADVHVRAFPDKRLPLQPSPPPSRILELVEDAGRGGLPTSTGQGR